jgi:hypothetical protein
MASSTVVAERIFAPVALTRSSRDFPAGQSENSPLQDETLPARRTLRIEGRRLDTGVGASKSTPSSR